MKTAVENSNLPQPNKIRYKVFLFILVLTSIIWLLIELSKTYTSSAVFQVEYKNIPSGKLLQNKPISELNIAIKAPGFSLIKYKTVKHKIIINLNTVVKKGFTHYLLPNRQLSYINGQLVGEVEAVDVLLDTIFVELGNNKFKKVPVNPVIKLNFKLGYNLTDKIKISPDSILITGPQKYVDSITELTTEEFTEDGIYKSINQRLTINAPLESTNLLLSATEIEISAEVDKFTEGKFVIPVKVINEPVGVKMNTFPKNIEVVYQAGLSNFNKINENSFLIVYDYNQYKNDTLIKYLSPVIKQKSDFISALKINPNQIEFLIQK
jgi:hypothetical protein